MNCEEKIDSKTIELLKKKHTKQLIDIIHSMHGGYCCEYCHSTCYLKANKEILRSILSERPHIPNKEESKAIRKARIKEGK